MSDTTTRALVAHPATGELLNVADAATTELVDRVQAAGELLASVREYVAMLEAELVARLDFENKRKATIPAGEWLYELEVNPPTETEWPVDELRAKLLELVDAGRLAPTVVPEVIKRPEPRPPEPRVAKRELGKLLADPDIAAELEPLKRTVPAKRKLKLDVKEGKR